MPASTMTGRSISSMRIWIKSRVARPLLEPMGAPRGIDGGGPGVGQVPGHVQVGVHVGQDHKPLLGQRLCGLNGLGVVGEEVLAVPHDLDFHKVPAAQLPGQPGDAHRLLGVPGPRGVGQEGDSPGDVVQNVLLVPGVGPADGQGDEFCPGVLDGGLDELQGVFPRPQNEPGGKGVPADDQRIVGMLLHRNPFFLRFKVRILPLKGAGPCGPGALRTLPPGRPPGPGRRLRRSPRPRRGRTGGSPGGW